MGSSCFFRNIITAIIFIYFTLTTTYSKLTTDSIIRANGYPAEAHKVQTSDGYILQLFRIPNLNRNETRPVAFVFHGLLSSSDGWVLSNPDQSLPFALADAGYDVWLGNCRGNSYSRNHATMSPLFQPFWSFEWHQIGIYDLPAMIDYVLYITGQSSLHYVGHSQGTSALLVMLSMIPPYNAKIKTAQLLAPVAYMSHMKSPLAKALAPLMGRPNAMVEVLGSAEFMPNNLFFSLLGAQACKDSSPIQAICSNSLFLVCGFDSVNMNKTLLPDIMRTHPAGASVNQLMHYLQEQRCRKFRQFDYGNKYGKPSPPGYALNNITAPIYMYYSDNDWMSAVKDVAQLILELPNVQLAYRMPDKKWNHLDFLWATGIRDKLYNSVIRNMN